MIGVFTLNEIETAIFGREVYAANFEGVDVQHIKLRYRNWEDQLFNSAKPFYVYTKIPAEQIETINVLEEHGFGYIETQIRSRKKITYTKIPVDDYLMKEVDNDAEVNAVFDIARSTFVHDRIYRDHLLESSLSGLRYAEFVLKSYQNPKEKLLCLIDKRKGEIVAFKTHRYIAEDEVLFLLGGVHPDMKNYGLGALSNMHEFNYLHAKGILWGTTHISAINYPILNLEIGKMNFKVTGVFVIMRKVFP